MYTRTTYSAARRFRKSVKIIIIISQLSFRDRTVRALYADEGNYCCKILLYIRHVDTKVWRGSFRLGGVGVGLKIYYTVVGSEKSERTFHIVGMKMMTAATTTTTTTLIISYYYYYYYYYYYHHRRRSMSIIVPTSIVHPLQGNTL